jgi:hypothetical protein
MYWRHLQWIVSRKDDASELLNRHPQWLIVMQVVVEHAPRRRVASSGFFGLLGDAPLQIIDLADAVKIDAMSKLAQDCDNARLFKSGQELNLLADQHALRMKHISELVASREMALTTDFRPSIAFLWCPLMCPGPCAPTNGEEKVDCPRAMVAAVI